MSSKPVILTGLRANNDLHIGNYFGGLLPMIDIARQHADEYQINLFLPDLHSFTTPVNHEALKEQIIATVKLFVGAGLPIDHQDVHIYRQSYIPAHSELTWILDCFTGFGEMSRMTQFKDKSSKLGEGQITVGLFNYPVLQAADILLYGAKYVPVGEDQTQHLEFTRDIGIRMNNRFGELFEIPEPAAKQHEFFSRDQGLRIRDLADPSKKMSKSDETGKGVVFLSEAPADAGKKIMRATTDNFEEIRFDLDTRPGISNLLQILALLKERSLTDVIVEWEGKNSYGELKKEVAAAVESFLTELQTRLAKVSQSDVLTKMEQSEAEMNQQANATLLKVQKAIGLR